MRRRPRQAGFALLMVMLLVAMAVVAGLTYLSSASIKLASSNNLLHASRAKYLAESGLQHALYVLKEYPETFSAVPMGSPIGPYHADGTSDTYVFSVTQNPTLPRRYVVTAEATVGGVIQKSSAAVYRFDGPVTLLQQGVFVSGGSALLPPGLRITGDVHINGSLYNLARIDGDVSASGTITDPKARITGVAMSGAETKEVLGFKWDDYKKYHVFGMGNEAVIKTTSLLTADDPLANGGAITPGNVGGVVWLQSESGQGVTLGGNLNFQGTIITNENLILGGTNIVLTPVEGFPALVVNGKIITTHTARVSIQGLVIAANGIVPYDSGAVSQTDINGGLLCELRGYDADLSGQHTMNYVPERCQIYNVMGEIEVISWED
jgi:cytoskeletal protein CcmA (bactofilin family)